MDEQQPTVLSGLAAGPEASDRDLFRLVLTVVDLSRQLMEKQVARDDHGELTGPQRDALALGLERLDEAVEGFRRHYGLPVSDLEIALEGIAPSRSDSSSQ